MSDEKATAPDDLTQADAPLSDSVDENAVDADSIDESASTGDESIESFLTDVLAATAGSFGDLAGAKVSLEATGATRGGADSIAALCEGSAVVAYATAQSGSDEFPLALLADEKGALAVAGVFDDEVPPQVDENVIMAFGEVAGKLWAALDEKLGDRIAIKAGDPQALDGGLDGFGEGGDGGGEGGTLCFAISAVLGEAEAGFTLVVPQGLGNLFVPGGGDRPQGTGENIKRILRIRVPLVVRIARRNTNVGEVLSFRPGTVIEFPKRSDDLLDLLAGAAPIGRGEAVKVVESFGIRIIEIGGMRETLEKLST